mmetsp:Transcript_77516/g.185880  ORF Transcript_77516/g.185880 Transcript_77516/m.185880 type:complete len:203 (+) Transcript_77516:2044-2652(+)
MRHHKMPVLLCMRNQHEYSSSDSGMPTASLARARMLSLAPPSREADERSCFSLNLRRTSLICSVSLSSDAASSSSAVSLLPEFLSLPIWILLGSSFATFLRKKSRDDLEGTTPRSNPTVVPVLITLAPVFCSPPLMAPVIEDLSFLGASSNIDPVVGRCCPRSEFRDACLLSCGVIRLLPCRPDASSSLSPKLSDESDVRVP